MTTKNKIPGDILKTMRIIDKQTISVSIDGLNIKMSRKQYDELMKCTLFQFDNTNQKEGDEIPSGFYLVDTKTKSAKFKWLCPMKKSTVSITVNERIFKVNAPWIGFSYA